MSIQICIYILLFYYYYYLNQSLHAIFYFIIILLIDYLSQSHVKNFDFHAD